MSDDHKQVRDDWQGLVESPGWKRLITYAAENYGAGALLKRLAEPGDKLAAADLGQLTARLLTEGAVATDLLGLPHRQIKLLAAAEQKAADAAQAPAVLRRA